MQKPNSKAKYWLGICVFEFSHKDGFSKKGTKYRIKHEHDSTPVCYTQTIIQQLPGLQSSGPTCPGLAHWPPKTQNN